MARTIKQGEARPILRLPLPATEVALAVVEKDAELGVLFHGCPAGRARRA